MSSWNSQLNLWLQRVLNLKLPGMQKDVWQLLLNELCFCGILLSCYSSNRLEHNNNNAHAQMVIIKKNIFTRVRKYIFTHLQITPKNTSV